MLPKKTVKYLSKYSYQSGMFVVNTTDKLFDAVCVIPALSELENIAPLLDSLLKNDSSLLQSTLFLFVVNNTEAAQENIKINNAKTIQLLINYNSELNIEVADASTKGRELDRKNGGVGLARKIGMDYALRKFNYGSAGAKFFICLDADCTVSENYLSAIYNAFNERFIKTGYVNFKHSLSGEDEIDRAIINYELFLRYYVLGLRYARSPYAFHTIGSTMLCDYDSYVTIGGMNKRKAGEDFYFLEKLSKNFNVEKVSDAVVYPSSRPSLRVPFGTGQRVNRFIEKSREEYLLYNPESFETLKKWNDLFLSTDEFSSSQYLKFAKDISKPLYNFLSENNFEKSWEKVIKNCKTAEQLQKQKKFWFDGFRTLKLIHYLRDKGLQDIDTFDAVREMMRKLELKTDSENINRITKRSSVERQMDFLKLVRKAENY